MTAFAPGARVRVLNVIVPGHVRTPHYVRGKHGVVAGLVGEFDNPEELAWGRAGDRRRLYRVRFLHADVFPDAPSSRDEIDVEIFEHWLEQV
jgi:nitrile hydratase